MLRPIIAYHGTNREAAASIHLEGFRPGSWFARRIEAALAYGGPCIFMVKFSSDPAMWHGEPWEDDWQFHISGQHGPENIVGYTIKDNLCSDQ